LRSGVLECELSVSDKIENFIRDDIIKLIKMMTVVITVICLYVSTL